MLLHQYIWWGWGANSALQKGEAEKIAPKASASKCNIHHATEPPCLCKFFTQLWALKLKNCRILDMIMIMIHDLKIVRFLMSTFMTPDSQQRARLGVGVSRWPEWFRRVNKAREFSGRWCHDGNSGSIPLKTKNSSELKVEEITDFTGMLRLEIYWMRDCVFFFNEERIHSPPKRKGVFIVFGKPFLPHVTTSTPEMMNFGIFSPQIRPHIHQPEMGSEESLGWVWRGVAGAVSRILRWYNNHPMHMESFLGFSDLRGFQKMS